MINCVILHIGTHKTGTTTLQEVLAANEQTLAENGFVYPQMPRKFKHAAINRNAFWLNMEVMRRVGLAGQETDKIPPCRDVFEKALKAGPHTVVISDERLWYNATKKRFWKEVRTVLEECGATNVKVVLYLRRQDLFLESLWAQYVKSGHMEEGLTAFAARKKNSIACDYAAGVRSLQEAFGAENLIIRVYDRKQLVGGDTVEDFLQAIGIRDTSSFVRPEVPKNPSLSPSMTLLKLYANRSHCHLSEERDYLCRPALQVSDLDPVKRGSFFTPQQRQELMARYEEGNAWIARECLGREDGVLFPAAPGEMERPAFEPEPLKVALQTCQLLAEALAEEREQRKEETARLKERIEKLERSGIRKLTARVERKARKVLGR